MTELYDQNPAASQLLRDSVDDLPVDVDLLVRGGVSRGRTMRRRRRVGASLAAAVVVGAIGVAASVGPGLLDGGADGRRDIDVATGPTTATTPNTPATTPNTPSTTPNTSATTDEPDAVLEMRALAVTQAEIPDVFATLVPGEVTAFVPSGTDEVPFADFLWDGTAVRVAITPQDYAGPDYVGTPEERCAISQGNDPGAGACRSLDDGTAVLSSTNIGPEVDGGITTYFAHAFTPDGWDVLAMASNAADTKDSEVLGDEPLVSLEQLLEVAASDAWFSES